MDQELQTELPAGG